jgi:hypothetical protein
MLPKEFIRKSAPKVNIWPYILAVIFFIILDLILGYLVYKAYQERGGTYQTENLEDTPSTSLTRVSSSDLPQGLSSPIVSELEEIQTLADAFMQARLSRNLERVKPYVTEDFLDKYDQKIFAGSSSPSLDDYEITDIRYVGGNTYRILVQTNWILNGDEAGSQDWTLIATKTKKDYKINDYSGE